MKAATKATTNDAERCPQPQAKSRLPGLEILCSRRFIGFVTLIGCILASIYLHRSFLREPHRLILDDASDIVRVFRPLIENPSMQTIIETDESSRYRPMYWIIRAFIHWLGNGEVDLFWYVNAAILGMTLFMSYCIAGLLTKNRFVPILAPVLLFFIPGIVENYCVIAGQEPWIIFFESIFIYLLLRVDRSLASGSGWRRQIPLAIGCWMSGIAMILSKAPGNVATLISLFALIFTAASKRTPGFKPRIIISAVGFVILAFTTALSISHLAGVWRGEETVYSSNFILSGELIADHHAQYSTLLAGLIWPLILAIPLTTLAVTLLAYFTSSQTPAKPYVKYIIFFALIAAVQYVICLPWLVMVRYLFPAALSVVIINTLCVDYTLQIARKG